MPLTYPMLERMDFMLSISAGQQQVHMSRSLVLHPYWWIYQIYLSIVTQVLFRCGLLTMRTFLMHQLVWPRWWHLRARFLMEHASKSPCFLSATSWSSLELIIPTPVVSLGALLRWSITGFCARFWMPLALTPLFRNRGLYFVCTSPSFRYPTSFLFNCCLDFIYHIHHALISFLHVNTTVVTIT